MKEFWTAERTIFPAIFRLVIGFVLLFDLFFTYSSADIFLNPEFNFLFPNGRISGFIVSNYQVFFLFYGLVLIFFILGLFKNLSSFLVFSCNLILFYLSYQFTTWGDIILKFSLLYFVFVDSFRYFSILKSKGKISFISVLAVWSMILHVFMIYLNNAYFKLTDNHWQEGVAVYYSFAQYPEFKDSILNPLVSNAIGVRMVDYFIIAQQLLFVPFVIWKKTRYFMLILASLIHLTMMFQFGLWKFELVVVLLYGFLLSDEEWKRILPTKISSKYLFANQV